MGCKKTGEKSYNCSLTPDWVTAYNYFISSENGEDYTVRYITKSSGYVFYTTAAAGLPYNIRPVITVSKSIVK